MIGILIWLLILLVVFYVAKLIMAEMEVSDNIRKVVLLIIGLIGLLSLFGQLGFLGTGYYIR